MKSLSKRLPDGSLVRVIPGRAAIVESHDPPEAPHGCSHAIPGANAGPRDPGVLATTL